MPHYESSFKPAFLEGHTIRCHHGTATSHVRVKAVRATGIHEHDWGTLTAGATPTLSSNNQCTHLQLQDGEIGQYRFIVKQPFWVFLKHPASTRFMSTKNVSDSTGAMWGINWWEADRGQAQAITDYDFTASEFWVWEDEDPRFDLLALKSAQVPQAYVEFRGWRYVVEPLGPGEDGQVDLWMDTWPGK